MSKHLHTNQGLLIRLTIIWFPFCPNHFWASQDKRLDKCKLRVNLDAFHGQSRPTGGRQA